MLLLNILLALAWVAITGELTLAGFAIGFLLGYIVLWIAWRARGPSNYFDRVHESTACALHFIVELWTAAIRVSIDILTPYPKLRPAIIAIDIDRPIGDRMRRESVRDLENDQPTGVAPSAVEITTLANLITLTPGTLCLDVSPDEKTLFVHTMHADDIREAKHTIQNGLGQRVRRIFQRHRDSGLSETHDNQLIEIPLDRGSDSSSARGLP